MRLVEVRFGSRTVRLHPRLTVAADLDGEAVAAALRGEAADVTVVVELDGQALELSPEVVQRIGAAADVETVLRAIDLPAPANIGTGAAAAATPLATPSRTPPEPTAIAASDTFEPQAVEVDRTELIRAQAELEAAESAVADSKAAFERAEAAYREAREALARAEPPQPGGDDGDRALGDAERRLEQARARTAEARRRLVEARQSLSAGAERADQLQRRVIELEDERRELQLQAQAAADADPKKVEEALSGLRRLAQVKPKLSPEAIAIADRWAEARTRLGELPAPPAPPEWLVEPALAALQEAREAVARAEKGYLPFSVEPAQVEELERAHREVLEAEQKVMRKPSRLARRKLDQAHAAEREALQAMGVSSYGDYLQRVAPVLENPSTEEHLARARAALADAEAVWEELHGGQASAEYTAVREEMLAVKAEAVALLGTDPGEDQLEEALRNHTEAVVDTTWARQALADVLAKFGVEADVDDPELDQVAERWLADAPDTAERRQSIDERLKTIEEELTEAQGELSAKKENEFFGSAPSPESGNGDALAALQVAIDEAAAAEAQAEEALAKARNAAAARAGKAAEELGQLQVASDEAKTAAEAARRRLEESEAALEAARRAVEEAAEAVAAASAAAMTAAEERAAEERAAAERAAAEQAAAERAAAEQAAVEQAAAASAPVVSIAAELYLLARIASVRSAGLPLVVLDAFADLPTSARDRMHRILDRSADSVQVLYVTTADDAAGWVERLGDRAALAAS